MHVERESRQINVNDVGRVNGHGTAELITRTLYLNAIGGQRDVIFLGFLYYGVPNIIGCFR